MVDDGVLRRLDDRGELRAPGRLKDFQRSRNSRPHGALMLIQGSLRAPSGSMSTPTTIATKSAQALSISDIIFDQLPTPAYVCDDEGRIVRCNRQAIELWGRRPRMRDDADRFCGSHRLHWPHGPRMSHSESPMAAALLSGGVAADQEIVIERPNGERVAAMVRINLLHEAAGGLVGAAGCFQVIGERPEPDEQLQFSQRDLEDFFENGVVALHWVGPDGRILRANQAELDLLGYESEEYVGQHIAEFHVDRDVIDDILARLSCHEKLERYPARLRTKSGEIRHVLISSNVYSRDGEFVHTRCLTLDVTERHLAQLDLQESERRSRELLEALPAAIYTTDTNGALTFYNEAAAELWGVRPELGTSYWCGSWRLFWPDGTPVPHDECPMAIALKENRVVRNIEAIAERPDGTRVPFMPYPTPLHDADHRLVGAVNMLIDLTHLKQAHRRQQLLINELNHRVKNTLATIQSIAHQTFRGKTDEELKQRFEKRLIALAKTHDILTREDWRGADLRELISQLIEFACDAGERAIVDGPSVLLPQRAVVPLAMAIHELCTNASKYGALTGPAGRIVIEWQFVAGGTRLQLRWVESGGPPVQVPVRRGFGTRLLERGLPHELRADCKLTFQPSGVVFVMDMPLSAAPPT